MKKEKWFRRLGVIILLLIASVLMRPAGSAMAAPAPAGNDILTVTVSLQNTPAAAQAADQISLDLKQGSSVKASKTLAETSSNDATISYTPVTFSNVATGNYTLCLHNTSSCENVTKDANADNVSFNAALSDADAAKLGGTAAGTSNTNTSNSASNAGNNTSCEGQQLGWIICPVVSTMQNAIGAVENSVIVPFLQTQPLHRTNADGSAAVVFTIWNAVRDFANALLIIVFLFLIFGHTLSFGADAYTIKRTLPRLVVAAILIQFSFLIASLGIDITNILGGGVGKIIGAVVNTAGGVNYHFNLLTGGLGLTALVAGAVALIGSVLTGAILLVLLAAFLGVVAVFLTLIARQIIITLLVIVAPLAFLLMVLPGTESMFRWWRTNFIRVLLMYPLIVLLFAASRVVAVIATASGGTSTVGNQAAGGISSLVALVAAVVPLFLIPAMFKFAGSAMHSTSELINKHLRDRTRERIEKAGWHEDLKNFTNRRRTNLLAGQGVSLGALTGHQATLMRGKAGRAFGGPTNFGRAAQTRSMKALRKAESEEGKRLDDMNLSPDGLKMVVRGPAEARQMIANQEAEIARLRATGASDVEIAGAVRKLGTMKDTEKLARQFYGNASAQMSATSKLADIGQLDDDVRNAIYQRGQKTGDIGRSYANLVWGSNFKMREGNPVLQNTSLDGFIDYKGVEKNITGRSADSLKQITKDGWDALASLGMIDKLSPATLTHIMTPGPNAIADVNIQTIEHYQQTANVANQDRDSQLRWLNTQGRGTNKYELLKNRDFLGGLIAESTGNSDNEKRLRAEISQALEDIRNKADYAATIDGRTRADAATVKDDDWKSFENYRDEVWKRRVNIATGEKKENWDVPPNLGTV